jgi:hypothetical protein
MDGNQCVPKAARDTSKTTQLPRLNHKKEKGKQENF